MESSGMFYGEHPTFDATVDRLRTLELKINAAIPVQLNALVAAEKRGA